MYLGTIIPWSTSSVGCRESNRCARCATGARGAIIIRCQHRGGSVSSRWTEKIRRGKLTDICAYGTVMADGAGEGARGGLVAIGILARGGRNTHSRAWEKNT